MDTKRVILAIVLSIGVLVLWQTVMVKKAPETAAIPPRPGRPDDGSPACRPGRRLRNPAARRRLRPPRRRNRPRPAGAAAAQAEERITIATPLYTAQWTQQGRRARQLEAP